VADLAKFSTEINPFQMGGPNLWGLNPYYKKTVGISPAEQIEASLQRYAPDMGQPQTAAGKILGEIGYYAPSALIPGAGAVKSTLAAGTAAGLIKAGGGGETAQAIGGLLGALTPSGAVVASKGLSSAAKGFENWGLDIARGDVKRSLRKLTPRARAEAIAADELPLDQALQGAKSRGLLKGPKDATSIEGRNIAEMNRLDEEIKPILDLAQKRAAPTAPTFENATRMANAPGDTAALKTHLAEKRSSFEAAWKANPTLEELQAWKRDLYATSYRDVPDGKKLKALDRALANDFKTAIEDNVSNALGPAWAETVAKKNALIGQNAELMPWLENAAIKQSEKSAAVDFVKRVTASPWGTPAAGLAYSAVSGNIAPALIAGGLWGLASRPGRFATSKVLGAGGDFANLFAGKSKAGAASMLASLLGGDSKPAPSTPAEKPQPESVPAPSPTPPKESAPAPKEQQKLGISDTGLNIIKRHEGLRLKAYKDAVGKTTIGYGHTATAETKKEITEKEAEVLLRKDVAAAEAAVRQWIKVPLTQNQFDALVSFTYNVGPSALARSTLLKKLNSGDKAVAAEFLKWTKAGGRALPGLQSRRTEEMKLFG
jgi:lysozyme